MINEVEPSGVYFISKEKVLRAWRLTDVLYRFVLKENMHLFLYKNIGDCRIYIEKNDNASDLKVFHGLKWDGPDINWLHK